MTIINLLELKKQYKEYNTCNNKFIKVINKAIIKETVKSMIMLIVLSLVINFIYGGI